MVYPMRQFKGQSQFAVEFAAPDTKSPGYSAPLGQEQRH
jgi:hypothetical protein